VFDFEWARRRPSTLGQLAFGLPRHVVPFDLALVAGLTEVGVAPAEPLGDGAAELALELDEVGAVLRAVLYTRTHTHRRALTANQLLRLVSLALLLGLDAIL